MYLKKISYIIASRNDNYCGDSVGRLQTTLNHTGSILKSHGVLEDSEIILTDWASPETNGPLRNTLRLNEETRSILRIAEVPFDIAKRYQKDSPFSEVHAMNVGFRKSSGKFFARIDQDTLIGNRFIKWFYEDFYKNYEQDPKIKVAFSGRRNLSKDQSLEYQRWVFDESKSHSVEICHPNNYYSRILPNKKHMFMFYGGAVGVMMVERDLFLKEKGFNEDFIYMNNMDTEFMNRLKKHSSLYNLGLRVQADFYHLNHERSDGAVDDVSQPHADQEGCRTTNNLSIRQEDIENLNTEKWGLEGEDLKVYKFI
jgi:hypothetical protein